MNDTGGLYFDTGAGWDDGGWSSGGGFWSGFGADDLFGGIVSAWDSYWNAQGNEYPVSGGYGAAGISPAVMLALVVAVVALVWFVATR